MRADLALIWSPNNRAGYPRRLSAQATLASTCETCPNRKIEDSMELDEEISMEVSML